MKKQNIYMKNLPENIQNSLIWYTGGNFDKFNKLLRNEQVLDKNQSYHKNNIDTAFMGVPLLDESIILYKGKNTPNVYSDKSFVSTSNSLQSAMQFSGKNCCILVIQVTKGSRVLPLKHLSKYTEENEYLLDRNSTLIVTNLFEENGMKYINCIYTNGIIISSHNDIKHVEKTFKIEDNESTIITRLFEIFENEDKDYLDEEDIKNMYNNLYPSRKQDTTLIKNVAKLLLN
jgi:hypothetical protein